MYNFIVNPNARSGLGQKVWKDLETILKNENVEYQVFFTKYQRHATTIVQEITSDDSEHIIIALGGDGTVNEVVNGIANYAKTILGYIPIGSSNDFARGLELPTEPSEALRTILAQPNLHPMDIGELRYKNKIRRFAVSAGFGFDADICHEVVVSHLKHFLNKLKLGKLTYVGVALHRLFLTTPRTVTLTLDTGEKLSFPKTYFVALMNNRYEGGGAKFAPSGKNDDGKLDVMVASDVSKIHALMLFPLAFAGLHVRSKAVHMYQCSKVELHCDHALPLHTDGEPIFLQSNVTACCVPEKLRVITTKQQ